MDSDAYVSGRENIIEDAFNSVRSVIGRTESSHITMKDVPDVDNNIFDDIGTRSVGDVPYWRLPFSAAQHIQVMCTDWSLAVFPLLNLSTRWLVALSRLLYL